MVISDPDYSTFPLSYELDWYEKDKVADCEPPDLTIEKGEVDGSLLF